MAFPATIVISHSKAGWLLYTVVALSLGLAAQLVTSKTKKRTGHNPWSIPPMAWGVLCAVLPLPGVLLAIRASGVGSRVGFGGSSQAHYSQTSWGDAVSDQPGSGVIVGSLGPSGSSVPGYQAPGAPGYRPKPGPTGHGDGSDLAVYQPPAPVAYMPNDVGFQPGPGASGYQAVGNPAYQSRTGAAAGGGTAAGGAFVPYSASKSLRPPMPVARAAQKPAGAPIKPALIKPALGTPAAWMTDPTSRHQLRYFDGASWTENVANDGIASVDPLD